VSSEAQSFRLRDRKPAKGAHNGSVVFMISTAVLLFLRPQPPHPTETHVSPVEILKNRKFVGFMGLVFGVMAVLYLGYEFAPKFLNEVKGIDVEQVGLLGSINALGGFTLGQLLGRRPPRLGVLISIGLVLIYGLVLLQASWVGWFILAYFLRGSYSAIRSLISALVTQLVPPKRLGVAFGAAEMVGTAADVVAPALAGRLYAISPPLPFGMMLALGSIALVVVGLFAPRPTAQPEPALASRPYD